MNKQDLINQYIKLKKDAQDFWKNEENSLDDRIEIAKIYFEKEYYAEWENPENDNDKNLLKDINDILLEYAKSINKIKIGHNSLIIKSMDVLFYRYFRKNNYEKYKLYANIILKYNCFYYEY